MEKYFYLYGAGELGKKVLRNFLRNGIAVKAFIDQKVEGSVKDVPIVHPDNLNLIGNENANSIVIICLNSGMLHKEVANKLYNIGFCKIVFLPMGDYSIEYSEKVRMTVIYNEALSGIDISDKIKDYNEYVDIPWKDNIIRYECDDILTWVGQEILFSENIDDWKGDITKIHRINDGIDVNLNAYCWIHNLFDYLEGKVLDCSLYLSIYQTDSQVVDRKRIIRDRESLYVDLQNKLSRGIDFFVEAATNVAWNSKGYFNIIGGNHRTIFLQHKGYVFYPVRMEKQDFIIWKNEECLSDLTQYIRLNEIEHTYVPIPHPFFLNFPYLRETGGDTVLSNILRYLGPIRLEGKNVIDVSQYEGYFARIARRMCAQRVLFYSDTKRINYLAEKIFKLLHLKDIEVVDNRHDLKQACNNADILFGMLNTEELVNGNYLQYFSGILFTEFYTSNEKFVKKVISNTQMNYYEMLHREVYDGEMLEIGVFKV